MEIWLIFLFVVLLFALIFIVVCICLYKKNSKQKNYLLKKDKNTQDDSNLPMMKNHEANLKQRDRLPPGLVNKKENCYCNALLQALASSSTLVMDLEELCKNNKFDLLELLHDALKALSTGVQVQDKVDRLIVKSGWTKTGHQDSYEMLAYLWNMVFDDFKQIIPKNEWILYQLPMKFVLDSSVQCGCKIGQPILQIYLALPLVLNYDKVENDLESMLANYFREVSLSDDSVCHSCEQSMRIKMRFAKAYTTKPNLICIHIQANQLLQDGTMIKPNYTLNYQEDLEIAKLDYHLVSMVKHSGSINVGHYVTFRKFKDDWFFIDDSTVQCMSFKEVKKRCNAPYILFYQRYAHFL